MHSTMCVKTTTVTITSHSHPEHSVSESVPSPTIGVSMLPIMMMVKTNPQKLVRIIAKAPAYHPDSPNRCDSSSACK